MGQYYHPTIINSRGHVHWLYSHEYDNGLKLMEHSYLGNNFCNAVLSQILHNPMQIAWMGDYAMDVKRKCWGTEPYHKLDRAKCRRQYNRVHGKEKEHRKIHPDPLADFEEPRNFVGWYLVNHTQKVYVDLGKFIKKNKWTEEWNGREYDRALNPLPLLTACGNGRGGGDYWRGYPDSDKVGTWAFDLIEFTDKVPGEYTVAEYHFKEE